MRYKFGIKSTLKESVIQLHPNAFVPQFSIVNACKQQTIVFICIKLGKKQPHCIFQKMSKYTFVHQYDFSGKCHV
jgi:hypothetical protein